MKPHIVIFSLGLLLATAGAAQTTRVIAFGDSLTWGIGDTSAECEIASGGYPARLPSVLQSEGHTVVVINEGECFETAEEGVSRIDTVLDAQGGDIVILMEGTNDISSHFVSIGTLRDSLQEMARKAEERGVIPITLSPIPRGPDADADADNTNTAIFAGWLEDDTTAADRIYANSFESLINVPNLFDVYYDADDFTSLHLNSSGYDRLTQIIRAPMLEALEPEPDPDPDPPPLELMCPAQPNTMPCTASDLELCLQDERFRLEVSWRTPNGMTGVGHATTLSTDTGHFWFFDQDNVELIVKILDGRQNNEHFWVFYGALSNVEYRMRVTDTETGACRVYSNPPGTFASVGDNFAFPSGPTTASVESPIPIESTSTEPMVKGASCVPSANVLCLGDGRFEFTVNWQRPQGPAALGTPVLLTEDTGYFWFANPANVELVVKLLSDDTHFWVFYGALSNLAYTMTVTDLETDRVRVYQNPAGTFASVGDTQAFPIELP